MEMVELEAMAEEECIHELRDLLENHYRHTGSSVAKGILDNWNHELPKFKKIMPVDYKRALKELAQEELAPAGS
jgi:glutamate synthase domain-containing protein 3